ncbi:hypothetical protein ASE51_14765 [Bacillus sp. Root147]|nr:hypothetical protein ASE51_14765 [Bacillus sp. Root147]
MARIKSKQLDFVVNVMKDFKHPWLFAGGWSIDLGIGKVTREHEDVDICIFREHALEVLSYFSQWTISVAIPGEGRLEPCKTLKDLDPPRYGLHLQRKQDFIEVLLTDRSGDNVLFRKNHGISMNYKQFVHEDLFNRKYVAPEWQLLFKAKEGRLKDEEDFKAYLPFMNKEQRLWLSSALQKQFPSSSWIKKLTS